jgi:hypothetical protein
VLGAAGSRALIEACWAIGAAPDVSALVRHALPGAR